VTLVLAQCLDEVSKIVGMLLFGGENALLLAVPLGVVAFDSCQEHAKAKTSETGHRELLAHWST
jgi:hypothetical protein